MTEEIAKIRREHARISRVNDMRPVIASTNGQLGVQYWTESDIYRQISFNTDRSVSMFIELL